MVTGGHDSRHRDQPRLQPCLAGPGRTGPDRAGVGWPSTSRLLPGPADGSQLAGLTRTAQPPRSRRRRRLRIRRRRHRRSRACPPIRAEPLAGAARRAWLWAVCRYAHHRSPPRPPTPRGFHPQRPGARAGDLPCSIFEVSFYTTAF